MRTTSPLQKQKSVPLSQLSIGNDDDSDDQTKTSPSLWSNCINTQIRSIGSRHLKLPNKLNKPSLTPFKSSHFSNSTKNIHISTEPPSYIDSPKRNETFVPHKTNTINLASGSYRNKQKQSKYTCSNTDGNVIIDKELLPPCSNENGKNNVNSNSSNNNNTNQHNEDILIDSYKIIDQEYSELLDSIKEFSKQSACDEKKTLKTSKKAHQEKNEMNLMTNTQDIPNFYEYTKSCMKLIKELEENKILTKDLTSSIGRQVNLPFIDKIGLGPGKKRLAIFDLDETLIHYEQDLSKKAQIEVEVLLPNKQKKKIGINIRPHWKSELRLLKDKYYLIIYTASHQSYADSVLNVLDGDNEIFDLRLYRSNCTQIQYEGQTFYIKDLRIFKDVSLKDMVIIDNSVLSFALHLDNGIPILPYYSGEDEDELEYLRVLLLNICDKEDLQKEIRKLIELKKFYKKNKKKK